MSIIVGTVLLSNALLFFFGAVQHIGIARGPFHEPRIIPVSIVGKMTACFSVGVA